MVKKLSFSYSKMGMYQECPQKYKFRYVHMLPEQPKYYFAFGTAMHAVMEYIYNPLTPTFPTQAEAEAFFKKHWDSTTFSQKGYATAEKEAAGFAEGLRIIGAYYHKHAGSFVHPLSTEMKSTLDTDGLSIISILDRVDYLGDGRIKILDYKTGKTVQREPDQLFMYQKMAENSPAVRALVSAADPSAKEIRVEQLSFYHLPSLTEMTFERGSDKEMYNFWQKVLDVAGHIRAGEFAPSPEENKCRWCDYKHICPVFTGKEYDGASGWGAKLPPAPSETPSSAPAVKTDEELLSEKIDRLGALQTEGKRLRGEITALMEKLGYGQHFAAQYKAELTRRDVLRFDNPEQTLALLRRLNLLAKTLVPTQSTIAALLNDPVVPTEAKEQLRALACTETKNKLDITPTI